jgi:hypothetical protein
VCEWLRSPCPHPGLCPPWLAGGPSVGGVGGGGLGVTGGGGGVGVTGGGGGGRLGGGGVAGLAGGGGEAGGCARGVGLEWAGCRDVVGAVVRTVRDTASRSWVTRAGKARTRAALRV